jgi:hypothetical protein
MGYGHRSTVQRNCLFVIRRHLVIDIADQSYPHLRCVVASQHVADEVRFDLHVYLHVR